MAADLRKYKFTKSTKSRPSTASSASSAASPGSEPPPRQNSQEMDAETLKTDILLSLRADIAAVIKTELKSAFAEGFYFLKNELQAVKAEIRNNTAAIHSEIDRMKAAIKEVEGGLTTWSDEVAVLQTTVNDLAVEVTGLRSKCEDVEGRLRRCNIRIPRVAETNGSSSTISVSELLREILQLDGDVLVDRSHRSLGPVRKDGKPRAVIANLHYYQDGVEVLSRARSRAPLRRNGETIAIFPDYTASVDKTRAALNDYVCMDGGNLVVDLNLSGMVM